MREIQTDEDRRDSRVGERARSALLRNLKNRRRAPETSNAMPGMMRSSIDDAANAESLRRYLHAHVQTTREFFHAFSASSACHLQSLSWLGCSGRFSGRTKYFRHPEGSRRGEGTGRGAQMTFNIFYTTWRLSKMSRICPLGPTNLPHTVCVQLV